MTLTLERATPPWKDMQDFVDAYHSYIRWADRPSRKMYYRLYQNGEMVGVCGLASAYAKPKKIATVMEHFDVAYNEAANNIVYCLHGSLEPNAGSHFIRLVREDAAIWWEERYGDRLKMIQTFILPPRNGAVFLADNWVLLGETSGKTLAVKTLTAEQADGLTGIEKRVFGNGQTRYLQRTFAETEKKLMLVRFTGRRDHAKFLKQSCLDG